MRKRWWQSKKVWGTIIAALLRVFGSRFGIDADTAADGALILLGGVSVEGVIDATAALRRTWQASTDKREGE